MYAKVLSGPHYHRGPQVPNPHWLQIEDAIRRMDDNDLSLVIIGADEDSEEFPWMGIGGGNGQYLVSVTDPDITNHIAVNPDTPATEEEITLVAGGQSAEWPANQVLDLEQTLEAAQTFAETGKLSERLEWLTD